MFGWQGGGGERGEKYESGKRLREVGMHVGGWECVWVCMPVSGIPCLLPLPPFFLEEDCLPVCQFPMQINPASFLHPLNSCRSICNGSSAGPSACLPRGGMHPQLFLPPCLQTHCFQCPKMGDTAVTQSPALSHSLADQPALDSALGGACLRPEG